ncbi:hypothetical protein AAY473_018963 [Plecturocebus cupreus]
MGKTHEFRAQCENCSRLKALAIQYQQCFCLRRVVFLLVIGTPVGLYVEELHEMMIILLHLIILSNDDNIASGELRPPGILGHRCSFPPSSATPSPPEGGGPGSSPQGPLRALTQDGVVGAALDPWAPACLLGSRVTQAALARPLGSHRTDADSEAAETLLPSGLCLQPPAFRGSLGPLCRGAREPTLDPEAPNLMEPRAPFRPFPSQLLKLRSRGNGQIPGAPQERELMSGLGSQASPFLPSLGP